MNLLLLFFALPIAIGIIAIVLEPILKSPIRVASIVFAIFLIITFTLNDMLLLIPTLAFSFFALITSLIVKILRNFEYNELERNVRNNIKENTTYENISNAGAEDLRIENINNALNRIKTMGETHICGQCGKIRR